MKSILLATGRKVVFFGLCFVTFASLTVAQPVQSRADEPKKDEGQEMKQLLEKALKQSPFKKGKDASAEMTNEEIQKLAGYLRRKYPYRSLRDRLAYEKQLPADRPAPTLHATSAARLKEFDHPQGLEESRRAFGATFRAQSLAMLHSDNVRKFITQEGFGLDRFGPPSVDTLELPEDKPLPLETAVLSTEHVDGRSVPLPPKDPDESDLLGENWYELKEPEQGRRFMETRAEWDAKHNPLRMPSTFNLIAMHDESYDSFASPWRNGDVKDLDHVAGFASHALSTIPAPEYLGQNEPANESGPAKKNGTAMKSTWLVGRMQLVSLLKKKEPGVYLSENVPRMEELKAAPRRKLDTFEEASLKKLRDGEDIVIQPEINRIVMLGAMRAAESCLECHAVKRGELLGAFTYELVRRQPVKLTKHEDAPAH